MKQDDQEFNNWMQQVFVTILQLKSCKILKNLVKDLQIKTRVSHFLKL